MMMGRRWLVVVIMGWCWAVAGCRAPAAHRPTRTQPLVAGSRPRRRRGAVLAASKKQNDIDIVAPLRAVPPWW